MARRFALESKIVARLDESRAEQLLPEAINDDARSERVIWLGKPSRQTQAISRCAFGPCTEQIFRHSGFDLLCGRIIAAANKYVSLARRGKLLHDHDCRDAAPQSEQLRAALVQLSLFFGESSIRPLQHRGTQPADLVWRRFLLPLPLQRMRQCLALEQAGDLGIVQSAGPGAEFVQLSGVVCAFRAVVPSN